MKRGGELNMRSSVIWALSVSALQPSVMGLAAEAANGAADARTMPFVQRGPSEGGPAKDAAKLPGNTWDSILRLPKLWGGSWNGDEAALARRIIIENVQYPPLKPEFLARSKQRVQDILAGKADFLDAGCRPWGMPRLIYYMGGLSFMMQPGVVGIFSNQPRIVYLDGRKHPDEYYDPDAIVQLTSIGHSIGHWDKDTLVIDTIGIAPETELFYGLANGGEMHIVERYRLTAPDRLDLVMTVDAPAVLERPWIWRASLQRRTEVHLVGDECDPNVVREKIDADGKLRLDLTPPP